MDMNIRKGPLVYNLKKQNKTTQNNKTNNEL